jgi:penicillin-insensitive murein endopeptidase
MVWSGNMVRRAHLAVAALLVVASFSHDAWSGTGTGLRAGHMTTAPRALRIGRSVGSPTDGRLVGGMHLDDAPYLRIVPVYGAGDVRWGLEPLVTLLDRSARSVRREFPNAVMSVGHLSRAGGGDLDRHASHESGRDADVGFYIRSQTARPLYADHFVPFRGDGTAPTWPGAYFDDARNWALVSAFVSDPPARVTYIFVASPLRARLLAYAEKAGAPLAMRSRAAELMVQPRGSLPHDDHFHVRIGCPAGMSECVEFPRSARSHHASHGPHGRSRDTGRARGKRPDPSPSPREPSQSAPAPHEAEPATPDVVDGARSAPAMIGEPMDDVDGPLTLREAPREEPTLFPSRLR